MDASAATPGWGGGSPLRSGPAGSLAPSYSQLALYLAASPAAWFCTAQRSTASCSCGMHATQPVAAAPAAPAAPARAACCPAPNASPPCFLQANALTIVIGLLIWNLNTVRLGERGVVPPQAFC